MYKLMLLKLKHQLNFQNMNLIKLFTVKLCRSFHAVCKGRWMFLLNNSTKYGQILFKFVHKVAYHYTLARIAFQPSISNFT